MVFYCRVADRGLTGGGGVRDELMDKEIQIPRIFQKFIKTLSQET